MHRLARLHAPTFENSRLIPAMHRDRQDDGWRDDTGSVSIPGMDAEYQTYYNQLRERVDTALESAFAESVIPDALRQAVRYSLMAPGKRLRPVLVLMAVDVCGMEVTGGLAPACAVEMVHTYSLIHDDLPAMDDDAMRRGRSTNHVVFGEALAILAGDTLLTQAFESLALSALPPGVIAECVRILAVAAGSRGMVGGQVLDLMAERGPFPGVELAPDTEKTVQKRSFCGDAADSKMGRNSGPNAEASSEPGSTDVAELIRIHRMKTGALIAASLELGAAVADVELDGRNRLREYGESCGLAFQIADDLLDVTGSGAKLGKETGRDDALGKLTYPGLLGVDGSRKKAMQLVEQACDTLSVFGKKAEPLRQLARFIVERDH